MKNSLDLIERLKASFLENKKIVIIDESILLRVPKDYAVKAFVDNNEEYTQLGSFFTMFSAQGISWRTSDDSEFNFLNGEFFFPSFLEGKDFFTNNSNHLLLDKIRDISTTDAFAVLDTHPEAGDGILYFMRFPLGGEDIEIWGLDTKETNLYKLTLDLPQYIAAMCHFKCIYDWQYLFVADEYKDRLNQNYYNDLLQRLELLKKYFPDVDIDRRDF